MNKKTFIISAALIFSLSNGTSGFAQQTTHAGQNSGKQGPGSATQSCSSVDNSLPPSPAEAEQLTFMREEEKLARDIYVALYQQWSQKVFNNISQSEQSHMDQVNCFLDAYGLPDPAQAEYGQFTNLELQNLYNDLIARGQTSLSEALRVGALIEEVDIRDLQAAIDTTSIAEVKMMYSSLMKGSENHLRAFVSNILALGETYTAQLLPAQNVDALLNSDASIPGTGIDITTNTTLNSQASFTTTIDTGVAGNETPLTQQTQLTLGTDIQPDPAHIGQMAQLINIAFYQPPGSRTATIYQLDAQGIWQPWEGDLTTLHGTSVSLQAKQTLTLFNGTFQNLPGYYQVFNGYLVNDSQLFYSSRPMSFSVGM